MVGIMTVCVLVTHKGHSKKWFMEDQKPSTTSSEVSRHKYTYCTFIHEREVKEANYI